VRRVRNLQGGSRLSEAGVKPGPGCADHHP
jgi:hypothetical protein